MTRPLLARFSLISAMAAFALSLGGCVEPPPPAPQAPSPAAAAPATPECREMHLTVMIGNQPQDAFGTACRQPDGTWRIRS